MRKRRSSPVDLYDQETMMNAERFSACLFRGRGVYETRYADTVPEALDMAYEMDPQRTIIYAIWGIRQTVVPC